MYINGGNQRSLLLKYSAAEERSKAWEQVIASAGILVATSHEESQLAIPLETLQALRVYIEKRRGRWNDAPKDMPSEVLGYAAVAVVGDGTVIDGGLMMFDPEAGDAIFLPTTTVVTPPLMSNQNRFSVFEEDEEDEESDTESMSVFDDDEDFLGSPPPPPPPPPTVGTPIVTMRRLLIRVLTSLSEVHAKISNLRRKQQQQQQRWTKGANDYALAFECLTTALSIADEEFARLFLQQEEDRDIDDDIDDDDDDDDETASFVTQPSSSDDSNIINNKNKSSNDPPSKSDYSLWMKQLAKDAAVVLLAIGHFSEERARYWVAAERRAHLLHERLAPQWEARDEVKQKLGTERWENNPNAKHDYTRQRAADERELKAITETMQRLEAMNTRDAYSRSQAIYNRANSDTTASPTMKAKHNKKNPQADSNDRHGKNNKSNKSNKYGKNNKSNKRRGGSRGGRARGRGDAFARGGDKARK